MRGTKLGDRPNVNGRSRFRSQHGVALSSAQNVALPSDDGEKRRSHDDRLGRRTAPPVSLPSPPKVMVTPPTTTSTSTPTPVVSTTRSPTSSFQSVSTAASSTQLPIPLEATSQSTSPTSFSAGTVIALSTVLPAVIILLLVVIAYLLRTRRRPSSRSRSGGTKRGDPSNELPMINIQHDLENARSETPFAALSYRTISPFNLSLHDLSQSMFFGGAVAVGRSDDGSTKTHVPSDSGLAHDDAQLPALPPITHTRSEPPPTPVLAVRYASKAAPRGSGPVNRTSIYMDRTSMDSGAPSSLVFARERTEEGSTGRISREELTQWGSRDGRTSLSDFPKRTSEHEFARRASRDEFTPSSDHHGTSGTAPTKGHGSHAPGRSGSKALRLLGIRPSLPLGLPLPARAHVRSHSQPVVTYGLPSLQLSPRMHASRGTRQPLSEVNPQGGAVYSPLARSRRPRDSDSRAESSRIHPHIPSCESLSTPALAPLTGRSTAPRERRPLSITIPPRLGAPIRPVAELIAIQSPSPQTTPRAHAGHNAPRSRSPSRTRGVGSPGQLSDLGVLERTRAAFDRPRGMSEAEPSPETRERILRLLGRLPEDSQGEGAGSGEGAPRSERSPKVQGTDRAREVRRTRSESGLLSTFIQQSSDA